MLGAKIIGEDELKKLAGKYRTRRFLSIRVFNSQALIQQFLQILDRFVSIPNQDLPMPI